MNDRCCHPLLPLCPSESPIESSQKESAVASTDRLSGQFPLRISTGCLSANRPGLHSLTHSLEPVDWKLKQRHFCQHGHVQGRKKRAIRTGIDHLSTTFKLFLPAARPSATSAAGQGVVFFSFSFCNCQISDTRRLVTSRDM